jgi:hypothetical protein
MNTNSAELIGENEAALQARVSASTLARFAEAGYFQVVLMGEERCYPKKALSTLFGVTFAEEKQEPLIVKKATVIAFPQSEPLVQTQEAETTTPEAPPASEQADAVSTTLAAANSAEILTQQPETDSSFKTILKMHADILERQEREIQDLRTEREWLKKRIERLEDKAERDQILLLSEAQTVKQLIQIQAQKKSLVRQGLEWLGVIPQELPEHDAVLSGKLVSEDTEASK